MDQLFYIPGGGRAHEHYINTILGSVKLRDFGHLLSPDQRSALEAIYKSQPIKVWGAVPGDRNTPNYERLAVGDAVLVYKDGVFTHVGYVSYKMVNSLVAELFWGKDEDGKTWMLIYFLKDVSELNLALNQFAEQVGYEKTWFPQGFSRLKDDKLQAIIDTHGSIREFFNFLSGDRATVEKAIEEAIGIQEEEEKLDEEEKLELEAEEKAEKLYMGLPEEERKRRAWQVFGKLKGNAGKKQPKVFKATRYERGPAGRALKEIYNYRCMVEGCGYTFEKKNGELYAEAHHLESLSDGGVDDPVNIIVLCPNHHRQFHYAKVEKISRNDKELIINIAGSKQRITFKGQIGN